MSTTTTKGQRWGDITETEDTNNNINNNNNKQANNILPAVRSETLDKNSGVKTVVEYTTNNDGKTVKITRKIRSTTKQVQINKNVTSRRQWSKFGECATAPAGPEQNVTILTNETINLDLSQKRNREEEKEESALDKIKGANSIVVCSYCKEPGHFSLKCPKRTQLAPRESANNNTDTSIQQTTTQQSSTTGGGAATTGKYIPAHLRNQQQSTTSDRRLADEPILRITNLSEDATEADLHELLRPFGRTTRIFLGRDKLTGVSRGFAFVTFERRDDAENALSKLNGHGYDNLILHVEWAQAKRSE